MVEGPDTSVALHGWEDSYVQEHADANSLCLFFNTDGGLEWGCRVSTRSPENTQPSDNKKQRKQSKRFFLEYYYI